MLNLAKEVWGVGSGGLSSGGLEEYASSLMFEVGELNDAYAQSTSWGRAASPPWSAGRCSCASAGEGGTRNGAHLQF